MSATWTKTSAINVLFQTWSCGTVAAGHRDWFTTIYVYKDVLNKKTRASWRVRLETTTGLAQPQSSVPPIRLFALCCPQISANTPKLKEHGILISDWRPSSLTAARWVPGTLGTRFLVPISDKLLCYAADKSTTGPVVDVDASSPLGVSSTRSPIRCLSLHHGVECSGGCRGFLCVCVVHCLSWLAIASDDCGSTVVLVSCADGTVAMWCSYPPRPFTIHDTPSSVVAKAASPATSLTLDYITSQKRAYRVLAGLVMVVSSPPSLCSRWRSMCPGYEDGRLCAWEAYTGGSAFVSTGTLDMPIASCSCMNGSAITAANPSGRFVPLMLQLLPIVRDRTATEKQQLFELVSLLWLCHESP
jgi:hypothetical protein